MFVWPASFEMNNLPDLPPTKALSPLRTIRVVGRRSDLLDQPFDSNGPENTSPTQNKLHIRYD